MDQTNVRIVQIKITPPTKILYADIVTLYELFESSLVAGPGVGTGVAGAGMGVAGAGASPSTVMTSFWLWSEQCDGKPQMYHFLPGVANVITS